MKRKTYSLPPHSAPHFVWVLLALCLLPLWAVPAFAGEDNPLKPIDTSSPRSTLSGFLEFMDKGYHKGTGLMNTYIDSGKLYATAEDAEIMRESFHYQEAAQRAMDLSEIPPAMLHESARRLAIQLKEVLDRVDIPPAESIPDAEAMAKAEFKRWSLPNSEIRLRRVESGPRAGEYLFSPETISRLPEFYAKVKNLPYKPGASVGWHEFSSYSPAGLAFVLRDLVPPRWLLDKPGRQTWTTFLDQPLWRWAGIVAVLGIGLGFVLLSFRLGRRWAGGPGSAGRWAYLVCPMSLVLVTPLAATILSEALRVSGVVYQVLTLSLWSLFYLALTWAVWSAGGAVAAALIAGEKLLTTSIDSQLIRLVARLFTVIAAVFILVAGADRVGLPAYSVLAGLGVGGLAVALAAQQTLANLLGSLIIMFEKPFAVGDSIKLKDTEGTVENVGFRSTRIRTLHNSLVTIPSSQLVNSTVDNLQLREYRQVKTRLNLACHTPPEKLAAFVESVRNMLESRPATRKDNIQVCFYEFGPASLDILLNFFLKVPDRASELAERHQILLDILRLAEEQGLSFALPVQTA